MKLITTFLCFFFLNNVSGQEDPLSQIICPSPKETYTLSENQSDSVLLCHYYHKLLSRDTSDYNNTSALLREKYLSIFKNADFKLSGQYAALRNEFGQLALDSVAQIEGLRDLGISYYRLGDYYKTNAAYLEAMKIAQQCQDSIQITYLLRWQAWLAWRMYDPDKAILLIGTYKKYIDALDLGLRSKYRYFNSIANFYRRNNDNEKARMLGDSAIYYARATNDIRSIGVALSNRSHYYSINSTKDLDWRIKLTIEALEINHEMDDREQLGSNYGLLARLHLLNNDHDQSIYCYKKSHEYSTAIGDRDREYIVYVGLSSLYDSLGMYKKAYEYELLENDMYRELYGVENITKVIDLQQEVAQTASQQQIDALVYEQSLSSLRESKIHNRYLIAFLTSLVVLLSAFFIFYRKRQRQALKDLVTQQQLSDQIRDLEQKTLRSQMNPHFIFNSLNSIKSHIAKREPRIATRYLTKFAHLMRLILQYSRETQISIKEELKSLQLYIELEQLRLNHEFDFELQVEDNLDTNMTMIPPMILQPYVENAIWHGLVNKIGDKKLNIKMLKAEDMIEIYVHDNGVGRAASKALSDNKVSEHKSFGMQITQERIEKNKAIPGMTIEIEDLVDNTNQKALGTEVKITLPFKTQIHETLKSLNY